MGNKLNLEGSPSSPFNYCRYVSCLTLLSSLLGAEENVGEARVAAPQAHIFVSPHVLDSMISRHEYHDLSDWCRTVDMNMLETETAFLVLYS